jgi:hypothetical protein
MAQKIIYLEIQHGKLVSLGMVDPSTLQWSGPPSDIANNTFSISFDNRGFLLGDVFFDDGKILFGVQLFAANGTVRTRIFGRHIVKDSGRLIDTLELSYLGKVVGYIEPWYQNTISYRKNIFGTENVLTTSFFLKNHIGGLKSVNEEIIIKRSTATKGYVIHFDTDSEEKNAGQGTVPYFDGSDIVQDFPLVLSGIGFIHYMNEGYGGYLRPVLKSADMKHYV